MLKKNITLGEVATYLNGELRGDKNYCIEMIAPIASAQKNQITFLEQAKLRHHLQTTNAGAVILKDEQAALYSGNSIIVKNPYLAFAQLSALFDATPKSVPGMHPTAIIGENCSIAPTASIAAYVVIGNNVTIGKNSIVGAHSTLSDNVNIGDDTRLHANVTLYHEVQVGNRTIIDSGAVIGADGFGMANEQGRWHRIHQLGSVIIGDDVEIGANTTIDRGALINTIIGSGAKIDNQIAIGHNVQIGEHTAIAGGVAIAGSTKIGKHCIIGGTCAISGHIELADGVILTGATCVGKSIETPGIYSSGWPAVPHRLWWRTVANVMRLNEIVPKLLKERKKEEEKKNA